MSLPKSMLGRYEFSEGSSNKFWEIHYVTPDLYQVTYGRIGTSGANHHYNEAEAYKKILEKTSKGYQRVDGSRHNPKDEVSVKREKKSSFDFLSELKKVK